MKNLALVSDILVIDDEKDICLLIAGVLEDEGYNVRWSLTQAEAMEAIRKRVPKLVILDVWLGPIDGLTVLEDILLAHRDLPVLMISGHANVEIALKAVKLGAYDFLEKPFNANRLLVTVAKALELVDLKAKVVSFKEEDQNLIEHLYNWKELNPNIKKIAQSNSRVFITGEAGTGNDLLAKYLHKNSERSRENFFYLDCIDAQTEDLFGKECEGKVTKIGLLESAHNSTLYLHEIGELSLELQNKLIKFLQRNSFTRLNGLVGVEVDVRLICSSKENLLKLIELGKFKPDLYYRLNVINVNLPPLRERRGQITSIAKFLLQSRGDFELDQSFCDALEYYSWPGNLRQLQNALEHVVINHCHEKILFSNMLPMDIVNSELNNQDYWANIINLPLKQAREVFERIYLTSQLERYNGNITKISQKIEMERSALHRKIKSLGLGNLGNP